MAFSAYKVDTNPGVDKVGNFATKHNSLCDKLDQSNLPAFTRWTAGTGSNSIIVNHPSNTAAGKYSLVTGKNNSTSGYYSLTHGVQHTNAGYSCGILGGSGNVIGAVNYACIAGGGGQSIPSGGYSFIGGGGNNICAGGISGIIGGTNNKVNLGVTRSVVLGGLAMTAHTSYSVFVPDVKIWSERGIHYRSGSTNSYFGSVNLSSGSAVVTTTSANLNSLIFLTHNSNAGGVGDLHVTKAAGSFTITSSNGSSTANIAWMIINTF